MSDSFPIRRAERLGYVIFWQWDGAWFHEKGARDDRGPFKTLEDAAYAAIGHADLRNAMKISEKLS